MINKNGKDYYDVIIVGAGIAGIECAKNLGNTGLGVLIVEKNKNLGEKVCAGGIILEDLEYIPKHFLNFNFRKIQIHYKDKTIILPTDGGIISTINRKRLLNHELKGLKKNDNIKILTGVSVLKILTNNTLELSSSKKLRFKFLVGADGSNSVCRKYLDLSTNKSITAFQYIFPMEFKNFHIYLDDKLFGTGYLWIFPHKNYTSIGCISDNRFINTRQLRSNFNFWLEKNDIDVSKARFQAAMINYDYAGYKFGNIFLIGDAAGLTSGLNGKGIYSAFLSGRQVANEILQKKDLPNLIKVWLKRKRQEEIDIFFLKSVFLRNIYWSIGIRLLSFLKSRIL
ncbi:MAG: NAD(P)/FAD-dependent oxidoreductase [Thermoplasmatales archaeon]|nr:NAD(P)/FAD-dependent oxidoreductase [Thermoplasmatales archaeon]